MKPTVSFPDTAAVQSPLVRRFVDGAIWTVAGSAGSSLSTVITAMVVARVLGKQTYGQFIFLQTGISMMGVFAGFGMGAAVTRYLAELKLSNSIRLSRILALCNRAVLTFGILIAISIVAAAPQAAAALLNDARLTVPVSFGAIAVLFATLDGFQKSVLIGLESTRAYAKAAILGGIVGLPLLIGAAYLCGLDGVAAALGINSLVQFGISRWQVGGELKRFNIGADAQHCLSEWRVVRDFAFPAAMAGLSVPLAHWICQRMLASTPDGYGEIALLGVVMQWFNTIMFLPAVAGRVVLPILTACVTSENAADSRRLLLLAMRSNALITFPMAVVIAIVSPWILSLYGPSFAGGSSVLAIAVFTAALLAVQFPVGNMVVAASRMWLGMLMNVGWAAVYIGLTFWTIAYGAMGVTIAMCCAYIVHSIWTFIFVVRQLHSLDITKAKKGT